MSMEYRLIALLCLLLLPMLGGCSSPLPPAGTNAALGLGAGVAVNRVEKRYDVECGLFNILEYGEYCVSRFKPTDRDEVHCFKSLGGVDCYADRDPYLLAGRSLPTAPRELADPPMPMRPPENRLYKVIERLEANPPQPPAEQQQAQAAQPQSQKQPGAQQ